MSKPPNVVLAQDFTTIVDGESLTGCLKYGHPERGASAELILCLAQGRDRVLSTHRVGDYSAADLCGHRELLITITPESEQLLAELITREFVKAYVPRHRLYGVEVAIVAFHREVLWPPHDEDDETEEEDD